MTNDKVISMEEKTRLSGEKFQQNKIALKFLKHQQKTASTKELRKLDARQKILCGAAAIDRMAKDAKFRELFQDVLKEYLVRAVDRKVFGLEPVVAVKAETGEIKVAAFEDVMKNVIDSEPAPTPARPYSPPQAAQAPASGPIY